MGSNSGDHQATGATHLRKALSPGTSTPHQWCRQALSDPLRRAILTGPGDDDYAEVDRPQE
jgi:hypothetical protein